MISQRALIPVPPSVNNLFLNRAKSKNGKGGGRIRTVEYEAWRVEAVIRMSIDLVPVTSYPVQVILWILAGKDFRRSRDVANCEKAATDALVEAKIIKGDSVVHVWDADQRYRPIPGKGHTTRCYIEIIEGKTFDLPEWAQGVAA